MSVAVRTEMIYSSSMTYGRENEYGDEIKTDKERYLVVKTKVPLVRFRLGVVLYRQCPVYGYTPHITSGSSSCTVARTVCKPSIKSSWMAMLYVVSVIYLTKA